MVVESSLLIIGFKFSGAATFGAPCILFLLIVLSSSTVVCCVDFCHRADLSRLHPTPIESTLSLFAGILLLFVVPGKHRIVRPPFVRLLQTIHTHTDPLHFWPKGPDQPSEKNLRVSTFLWAV